MADKKPGDEGPVQTDLVTGFLGALQRIPADMGKGMQRTTDDAGNRLVIQSLTNNLQNLVTGVCEYVRL